MKKNLVIIPLVTAIGLLGGSTANAEETATVGATVNSTGSVVNTVQVKPGVKVEDRARELQERAKKASEDALKKAKELAEKSAKADKHAQELADKASMVSDKAKSVADKLAAQAAFKAKMEAFKVEMKAWEAKREAAMVVYKESIRVAETTFANVKATNPTPEVLAAADKARKEAKDAAKSLLQAAVGVKPVAPRK